MITWDNKIMHKGFTLIEIVMAVVIFSVIMLGVVSVFVSGRRIVQHSRARMSAAELGKLFLDLNPSDYVGNEGNWTGTPMGVANGLDRNYTVRYTVNTLTDATNIYRIKAVINWTESE